MSDSVRPHRQQPTRLPRPRDFPGKNTGVGCHCLVQCMKVKSESEVTQSCPTLSDPMDCSPPGSSVHGIFQARVLEWGAIAFSGRKEQWPHKRLSQTALWVSGSLQQRRGSTVACCVIRGMGYNSPGKSPFEEVIINPTIVWPQTQLQGGNTAPSLKENWIKDLLSMAPPQKRQCQRMLKLPNNCTHLTC